MGLFEETHKLACTVRATASKGTEKPMQKQKQWLTPPQFRMLSQWTTIPRDLWTFWSSTVTPKIHWPHEDSSKDLNKLPKSERGMTTENVQSSAIWCIPKPTGSCDPQESQDHREWLGRTQRSIPKLLRRIGDCQAQLLQPARDEAGSNGKGLRFLDQGSTSHGSYQRAGADQHLR